MDRADHALPRLTPGELANPHTTVSINGFSVHLWQVAHLYGVHYDVDTQTRKAGASSAAFRRQQKSFTPPIYEPAAIGLTLSGLAYPDSPTMPADDDPGRIPKPDDKQGNRGRDSLTRELISVVDGLIDEAWLLEASEANSGVEPQDPSQRRHTQPRFWPNNVPPEPAVTTYPLLLHPPPRKPLPAPPSVRLVPSQRRAESYNEPDVHTLPAAPSSVWADGLPAPGDVRSRRDNGRATPLQRARSSHPGQGPSGVTNDQTNAVTTARLRTSCKPPFATDSKPALPNMLPHPLPSFLQRPPSFLQHPYEAQSSEESGGSDGGNETTTRSSATPMYSSDSANAAQGPTTPLVAVPTTEPGTRENDETTLTSRWSPDSSPERSSTMKRVRRALSFARLRPRKSKAALFGAAVAATNEAAGRPASVASVSRRNSSVAASK